MKAGAGQEFELWKMRERKGRKKPYEVRWRINDVEKSRSYKTKALAQDQERRLLGAARDGEEFSLITGEPVSWVRSKETVYAAAVAYARHAWGATSAGNTRRTTRDNLVRLVLAGIDDKAATRDPAPAPLDRVRSAVGNYALEFTLNPDADTPEERAVPRACPEGEASACLAWVQRVSRPLVDVAASTDAALALLDRSCLRVRGTGPRLVAGDTRRRRRGVLNSMLGHAVKRGVLAANPLAGVKMRRPRSSDAVNPRTVPDWNQAGRLLRAVADSSNPADRKLLAFFTVAYLAGTRPSETRAVREDDIIWPEDITDDKAVPGWGVLAAAGSRTEVGAAYTDDGAHGEDRELKGRAAGDVRMIPLPPEAVAVLRAHIATYGTAPDGRLFWYPTSTDAYDVVPGKAYRRTWARARKHALTTAEKRLNVAARPYDLRHGCASYLIGEGVPTPEVARRLGHTVEVLLTIYTHWFNHQEHEANALLNASYQRRGPLTGQPPEKPAENAQNTRPEG
ncbi:tyrosine-type recombinase/integrase [Nocardiopsis rhodophaea]|uniref:tyrosine-type recombinase/integrase n=1 Tax=Nocardiopsis rhodophaea TaxID=280238 RepID=UPI0031D2C214